MRTIQILNSLSAGVKDAIISKYSSLEAFCNYVYKLYEEEYVAFRNKDQAALNLIQNQLWSIEADLESYGLDFMDADYVISQIRQDYSDFIFAKVMQKYQQ